MSAPHAPGDEMHDLAVQFSDPGGLPSLRIARQTGDAERLADVEGAVRERVRTGLAAGGAQPGRIAVGVGSRGIAGIGMIVATAVEELRRAGFDPFVVPAMGSHGGGTPEGQLQVLASYGVTEHALGVPVRATGDTVAIGDVDGFPVAIDRHVVEAGAAFLINRIKPHTDFRGPIESGIAKMAAIGLCKQEGARAIHALGPDGLRDLMPRIGRMVARRVLVGSLGIIENEFDETMRVEFLAPEDVGAGRERALLEVARSAMPRLPFGELDALVIERIGKDISGTCLDPNVVGRWGMAGMREPEPLAVRCIAALELSQASYGNALGIGLVDFVPLRLAAAIDRRKTYVNGLTSGWSGLARTRLPVVLPTDRDVIATAAAVSGKRTADVRLAWIQDTLHTRVVAISPALWDEAAADAGIELGEPFAFPFDDDDALVPLASRSAGVR